MTKYVDTWVVWATAIAFSVSFWTAPTLKATQAGSLEIPFEGRTIGTVQEVALEPVEGDSSRFTIRLTAQFPSFIQELDGALNRRGNLNTCINRVHWGGRTSIRSDGSYLDLRSRIGYELWNCNPLVGDWRWLGAAGWVDWRMDLMPAGLDSLEIRARVTNIDGLPDWVERVLGLRITQNLRIPLLESCGQCGCIQDGLSLRGQSALFSRDGDVVRVTVRFSVASDLTGALQCLL